MRITVIILIVIKVIKNVSDLIAARYVCVCVCVCMYNLQLFFLIYSCLLLLKEYVQVIVYSRMIA